MLFCLAGGGFSPVSLAVLAVVAASEVREEENSCSRELYSFVSSGEMERPGLHGVMMMRRIMVTWRVDTDLELVSLAGAVAGAGVARGPLLLVFRLRWQRQVGDLQSIQFQRI